MKILRDPKRLNPCVLVLGMFDGVHRGHQALLMRGDELAQEMVYPLVVCCFEPHPLKVLAPEKAPALLTTLPEKARVMQSFGVDGLCITTFDRARAAGDEHIFLLTGDRLILAESWPWATVDGAHPNDLGFYTMAQAVAEVLRAVL